MKRDIRNAFLAATVVGALSLTACKTSGEKMSSSPSETPPPVAAPMSDPTPAPPADSTTAPPPETPTSGAPTTP